MEIYDDYPPDLDIWNFSNPNIVRERYHKMYKQYIDLIKKYYNVNSEVYPSSRKDKKYMIFGVLKDGNLGMVHFGASKYQDFTKHNDERRRQSYYKRFNKTLEPYSPYMLSKNLLW